MRPATLVGLNLAVTVAVVLAARLLLPAPAVPGPAAPAAPPPRPASGDLAGRVDALERRLDELDASVARWNGDVTRMREEADAATRGLRTDLEEVRVAVASAAAPPAAGADAATEKRPSDRLGDEMAKAVRQGIRAEFKRISDLVLHPTPEGEETRRRQVDMFAQMFARQAGLDDGQTATLKRIFQETDASTRDALRPVLQASERVEDLDYPALKRITGDSFAAQDRQFEAAFPEDKAEALKRQVEPIRRIFTATLEDLEAQGKADAAAKKPE